VGQFSVSVNTPKKAVATFPPAAEPEKADALAKMVLRPSVNAAAVMTEYTQPFGEQDIGALVDGLSDGIGDLWKGDMKRAEAMLYGQAHALQSIFMNLARRATKQEYLKQWEAYLRMALKAQNQCRMTLETLATIKNPPVVIARQANINNGGQQQVNNGTASAPAADTSPRAALALPDTTGSSAVLTQEARQEAQELQPSHTVR
jgi:hypothetical protein